VSLKSGNEVINAKRKKIITCIVELKEKIHVVFSLLIVVASVELSQMELTATAAPVNSKT